MTVKGVLAPVKDHAIGTLVGSYSDSDTTFTCTSGHGARLPDTGADGEFYVWFYRTDFSVPYLAYHRSPKKAERVLVTSRSTDTLVVTRDPSDPITLESGYTWGFAYMPDEAFFSDLSDAMPYSVKRFGARGDGATDDYDAFTACSNAANGGGIIFIPPGVYKLSDHIVTYSNQHWIGYGATLDATESPQISPIFNIQGKSRVIMDSIKFTGAGSSDSQQAAIYVYNNSAQVIIRNCIMDGFRAGVSVSGTAVSPIEDLWILNNRIINSDGSHADTSAYGVKVDDVCARVVIEGNLIDSIGDTTGHGIFLEGSAGSEVVDCVIRGNVIRSTNADGIRLLRAYRNLIANNVIISASGRGIYLTTDTNDNKIIGNLIRSCTEEGILVAGGASNADRNVIAGNQCITCNHGIAVSAADYNLIHGNITRDCTSRGVYVVSGTGNVYRDNIYSSCGTNVTDAGTSSVSDETFSSTLDVTGGATFTGDVSAVDATLSGDLDAAGGYRVQVDGWFKDSVPASQPFTKMERGVEKAANAGSAAVDQWVAMRDGSLTGVSVYSNEARTAGTCKVEVYYDAASTGLQAILDGSSTSFTFTDTAKDTITISAGHLLDIRYSTDGSWAPTTADIRGFLEVEQ